MKTPLFMGAAFFLAACSRAPQPPAAAPVPLSLAWNWLDFPRADRLTLAKMPAVIEPAHAEWIKAPREGWFELACGLRGIREEDEPVAALQPIGRMLPGTEALEEEGEALRRELLTVEDKLRKIHDEEAVESFLEQERRARQEIATYEAALTLADDPALRRDLLPQADRASREEITRLTGRLKAAKERLERSRLAGEKQAVLQKRQEELAEAKAAFERRQKTERDQLKAPFGGLMRFAVTFEKDLSASPEEPKQLAVAAPAAAGKHPAPTLRAYVRADTLIGVLRDQSAFWAKVEIADASLLSVPAKNLLFVFVSGQETVEAAFGGRAPEGGGGNQRMTPVYQFGIDKPTPDITRLVGGVINGALLQKLPQTAYLVPKMRLLIYRNAAFADGAWEKNCARVFPGCKVLAVGRDEVALVPPESAPVQSPRTSDAKRGSEK